MLSVAPILLLGVIVFVLVRKGGLAWWHALVTALFGFYLASSSAAPSVRSAVGSVFGWIGGLTF